MTAAQWGTLVPAVVAFLTAVTALIHSRITLKATKATSAKLDAVKAAQANALQAKGQ